MWSACVGERQRSQLKSPRREQYRKDQTWPPLCGLLSDRMTLWVDRSSSLHSGRSSFFLRSRSHLCFSLCSGPASVPRYTTNRAIHRDWMTLTPQRPSTNRLSLLPAKVKRATLRASTWTQSWAEASQRSTFRPWPRIKVGTQLPVTCSNRGLFLDHKRQKKGLRSWLRQRSQTTRIHQSSEPTKGNKPTSSNCIGMQASLATRQKESVAAP